MGSKSKILHITVVREEKLIGYMRGRGKKGQVNLPGQLQPGGSRETLCFVAWQPNLYQALSWNWHHSIRCPKRACSLKWACLYLSVLWVLLLPQLFIKCKFVPASETKLENFTVPHCYIQKATMPLCRDVRFDTGYSFSFILFIQFLSHLFSKELHVITQAVWPGLCHSWLH